MEGYQNHLEQIGKNKSNYWYALQTMKAFYTYSICILQRSLDMTLNTMKTGWRHIQKNRLSTIINVLGLGLGMAVFMFILFYVRHENSFDKFQPDGDRIFRINMLFQQQGEDAEKSALTPPTVMSNLLLEYPEVESAIRLRRFDRIVKYKDRSFFEESLIMADKDFLELFPFDLQYGDVGSALEEPNTVILGNDLAQRLFGDDNPVGETVSIGSLEYQVSGVLHTNQEKSHLKFTALISMATLVNLWKDREWNPLNDGWWNHSYYTYVRLQSAEPSQMLIDGLWSLSKRHIADHEDELGFTQRFSLQPLKDIYLNSLFRRADLMAVVGNKSIVRLFLIISIVVLSLACINFINLATARATRRAREIGMRKVIGANRKQLIIQFLGESILVAYLAALLAGFFVLLSRTFFFKLTGILIDWQTPGVLGWITLIALPLLVGTISGCYPAMVLSNYRPLVVLQNSISERGGNAALRKVLVVFQFCITLILLSLISVMVSQLRYMQSQPKGFTDDQVVVLPINGSQGNSEKYPVLRDRLLNQQGIKAITVSSKIPGQTINQLTVTPEGYEDGRMISMPMIWADYDYLDTYDLEIVAGRYLDEQIETDKTEGFVLNEAAVKKLGWGSAEQALGKRFSRSSKKGRIIGVIKDFHFNSLHQPISPLLIHYNQNEFDQVSVRVTSDNINTTLNKLEEIWKEVIPSEPFRYFFLEDEFALQYREDQLTKRIILSFSIIACIVAALGLYGLAVFVAERRTREMAIRRVLGASFWSSAIKMSSVFFRWIFWAIVIGSPISLWLAAHWLEKYAYRISLGFHHLLPAILGMVGIAVITIANQTISVVRRNPVETLRSE